MPRLPFCRTMPRPSVRLAACLMAALVAVLGGCTGESTTAPVVTRAETPTIRVKIGDSLPQARVTVRDKYQIRDLGTRRVLSAGDSLPAAVFATAGSTLSLDGRPLGTHQVTVVPRQSGSIVVAGQAYRGNLCVFADAGKVTLVNCLDLEDYLAGVVGAELIKGWCLETHKAQAIAARSFALYHMKNPGAKALFDVTDAPGRSQAYRGLAGETETSRRAIEATCGIVLTTDEAGAERIFEAFYHSTCDGRTVPAYTLWPQAPRIRPLGGVECPWCAKSPGYQWSRRVSTQAMARQLQPQDAKLKDMKNIVKAWIAKDGLAADGSVKGVWITPDRGGSYLIKTSAFKDCFPAGQKILSDRFSVSVVGGEVVVNGRGHGHAVGMCQYGAEEMADQGRRAEEILGFYYPGSVLAKVY